MWKTQRKANGNASSGKIKDKWKKKESEKISIQRVLITSNFY